MGVNLLGPRRMRRLRVDVADETVDHAFVISHYMHWVTWFATSDHRHGWHDRKTGEHGFLGSDDEACWSSCERFPDYQQRRDAQRARQRENQRPFAVVRNDP